MAISSDTKASLEFLTAGEPSSRPSLLFVHGAFCGGWVWAEHFLPFFAELGWHGVALSLRGHGRSAGRKELDRLGLADFVADVASAAASLKSPPVVVGHSMGGVVAQHFVQAHKAAGLALLAPASLAGLSGSFLHMSFSQPNLLIALSRVQSHDMNAADFETIRRGLFSENFPDDLALRYLPRFQRESLRANLELMIPQAFFLMARPRLPALVLGGDNDGFIPAADLKLSASFWGAEIQVLEGVPHALMLDTSWRRAAEVLADWLKRTFDPSPAPQRGTTRDAHAG
jgi:pimeloyl-ACP methyl ester carboxylesterase